MFTESQYKTLQIIKDYVSEKGFAPTISEIAEILDVKSRSFIQRNLKALADAGIINLLPNRRRNIELLNDSEESLSLPLMGRIAAGQPIEAISTPEIIDIPALILGVNRYLLQVKGDSMIGDNICDGDLIVCESANTAPNGVIVVALVDGEAATLKRIYHNKKEGKVSLIPSNPTLLPMEYPAGRVTIQGLYIGLLRLERR